MERGKAFSIMLGRLQHELCRGYGVDNARKVLQGALDSNDVVFARLTASGCCFSRGNIVSSNYWLMS